jgi:CBS domain-containing protein
MRKISDIMTSGCETVTTQSNLFQAAVLMRDQDVGFVPVVEGKKLVGVVTDRDLVIRGYADKHSGSTAITEVMSKNVKTVSPSQSVDEAADIMSRNQIRRLPVVENGHLIGVVALGDLAVRDIFVNEAGEALSGISEQDGGTPAYQ